MINIRCKPVVVSAIFLTTFVFLISLAEGSDIDSLFLQNSKDAPAPTSVYQPKPIPAGKDAFTYRDYYRNSQQWLEKALLSEYEEFGTHSFTWDDKVKELLKEYSQYVYNYENKGISANLQLLNTEVMALDCSDPHIKYINGNIVNAIEGAKKGLPLVKESLTLLEQSRYPRITLYSAANRLQRIYEATHLSRYEKEIAAVRQKTLLYFAQAGADKRFKGNHQRYYLEHERWLWGRANNAPADRQMILKELEATSDVDPWIQLMLRGIYAHRSAWASRGGGYANAVTEAGWRGFSTGLSEAAQCFIAAHEMHPEFPEAAALMVAVAMASCGQWNEREWFDRAVAAHFDDPHAYNHYKWALRPRWGGSHAEMYQFALECLNTKRFDTYIPSYFLVILNEIGSELDDWRLAYRAPRVHNDIKIYFDGKLAETVNKQDRIALQSQYAALNWLTEHYEEAQKLFDELGDDLKGDAFSELFGDKNMARAATHLWLGPFKEEFGKAEKLYDSDQSLEALPIYAGLKNKLQDAKDLFLIDDRLAVLRVKERFLAGDWVDVTPDNALAGWRTVNGEWKRLKDRAAVQGNSTGIADNIHLVSSLQMTTDFEIRGETEAPFRLGIILGYTDQGFATVHIDRQHNQVSFGYKFNRDNVKVGNNIGLKNSFHIQVYDECLTVYVNDTLYFLNEPVNSPSAVLQNGQLGLGEFFGKYEGHQIVYSNLQIRRLNSKPQGLLASETEAAESTEASALSPQPN